MSKKDTTLGKVGINGFGRIGRAIFRILLKDDSLDCFVLNDVNPDNKNIAYQLKYDSLYGPVDVEVEADDQGIVVDGKHIKIFHESKINDVPWEDLGVERVIDSSGVDTNVEYARKLKGKIKQVIVTHSPDAKLLDRSVILGVNENDIDIDKDFLISSSICDAVAFGPVAKILDENFGIDHGFLTTLHPWLQYQNLLDGPSPSWSIPGSINSHYTYGRASTFSLLPKPTSAISATEKVFKPIKDKFQSFSYRVPTSSVSSSNISVKLKKKTTTEELHELFEEAEKKQKFQIIYNNKEPLVSIDFKGLEYSSAIDQRWTVVNDGDFVRLVLWYDNEWGYSSHVVDIMKLLFSLD